MEPLVMQGILLVAELVLIVLLVAEVLIRVRNARRRHQAAPRAVSESMPRAAAESAPIAAQPLRDTLPSQSSAPVQEEADLSTDELLQEAQIYLQYGHYSQAATVLRWYVDLRPDDTRAINKLLDAYLALDDLEAYAQLLDGLGEQGARLGDDTWCRQRVLDGLSKDPGNLELLVLAEKLGVEVPAVTTQAQEPMSAAKALAIVSRNPDPRYGISILHAAIQEEPLRLPLYAELLRITHQQKDLEGFVDGLILMDIVLQDGGASIRERMLRAGMNLGPHALWEDLAEHGADVGYLRRLAESRHLSVSPKLRAQ